MTSLDKEARLACKDWIVASKLFDKEIEAITGGKPNSPGNINDHCRDMSFDGGVCAQRVMGRKFERKHCAIGDNVLGCFFRKNLNFIGI